jgi:hypothetical protein
VELVDGTPGPNIDDLEAMLSGWTEINMGHGL